MDEWVMLAPTRWKFRQAMQAVHETLTDLKVQHQSRREDTQGDQSPICLRKACRIQIDFITIWLKIVLIIFRFCYGLLFS